MYGKLINGSIYYAPKNYITDNGELIINFNNSEELMKEYGFKKIIDEKIEVNWLTEYLEVSEYVETEDTITIKYVVKEKQPPNHTPTLYDRVTALEEGVNEMQVIFDEEVNK